MPPNAPIKSTEVMLAGSPMAGVLVGIKGSVRNKRVSLSSGTVVIGRDPDACHIVLKETGASKVHARVVARQEQYFVLDDDSRNGTLVNGKPVHEAPLRHGDEIRIGEAVFRFEDLSPARKERGTRWLLWTMLAMLLVTGVVAAYLLRVSDAPPLPRTAIVTELKQPRPSPRLPEIQPSASLPAPALVEIAVGNKAGKVKRIAVKAGEPVETGQVLLELHSHLARDIETMRLSIQTLQQVIKAGNEDAQKMLASEKARLRQAELALREFRVVAPATGILEELTVEVGQALAVGEVIGRIRPAP